VVVPLAGVSRLSYEALVAAKSLGDGVVAVSVQFDDEGARKVRADWDAWRPEVPLVVLRNPDRHLIGPIVEFVKSRPGKGEHRVMVLIPEIEPRKRRHQVLQNQRGLLLATALRLRTDALICTLCFRLHE
jgi:hypothetical protein